MNKPNIKQMTTDQITHSLLVTNGHLLAVIAETLLRDMNTTLNAKDTNAMLDAIHTEQDVLNELLRQSIPEAPNGKA